MGRLHKINRSRLNSEKLFALGLVSLTLLLYSSPGWAGAKVTVLRDVARLFPALQYICTMKTMSISISARPGSMESPIFGMFPMA